MKSIIFLFLGIFSLSQAANVNFSLNVQAPQDTTPPANVSNFRATPGDGQITLSWENPPDSDFAGVRIQRSTSSYPLTKDDGQNVYDGKGTTFKDTGLTNGIRYYYTAFSYDTSSNFASGAITSAIPSIPSLVKKEEKVPPGLYPEAAPTVRGKEKITLEDVSFYLKMETGFLKIEPLELKRLKVLKSSPFSLSISSEAFKKEVNVITLTFANSSYLLKLNKEKKAYETTVLSPPSKGQFSLVIAIVYKDGSIDNISVDLLVDPYGYIFRKYKFLWWGESEIRIKGAKVTLYFFDKDSNRWKKWEGENYNQTNPKITDQTGEYAFFVPEGRYYLEVEKEGYKDKKTEEFEVKEQIINKNIEMEKKVNLWWILGVLILGGVSLFIRRRLKRREFLE